MIRRCIPPGANLRRSLDMDLCRALVKHVLKLEWKHEFVTRGVLWILGHWPEPVKLPEVYENLIFIDSKIIDCRKRMPMESFVDQWFENGGSLTALTNLCEVYELDFGMTLYRMHPYTEGLYNGCYFVPVQECILALSDDAIDWEYRERFERKSARLCSYEQMHSFSVEYQLRTTELQNNLNSILFFLERKEKLNQA